MGALSSLGVRGVSDAQLRAVLRTASGGGGNGVASAEDVIEAVTCALHPEHANSVRGVFREIKSGCSIPIGELRNRFNAALAPGVHDGRVGCGKLLDIFSPRGRE